MSIKNFIKIDVHLFHNNKFKLIKSIEKRNWVTLLWIRLLTEAGLVNDKGLIYLAKDMPYTLEMLSDLFENPIEDIKSGLDTLVSLAMIKIHENNVIEIINWCKYQETKRKPKKVKEEITETVANQATNKCDTAEIENETCTTNQNSDPSTVNVISPQTMNFSFVDDRTTTPKKKKNKSTKAFDNDIPIDINDVTEIVDENDDFYDNVHDGEFKPDGELLWEINFTDD